MEISEIKIAIGAITLLSIGLYIYSWIAGNPVDSGIIYTGIAAIAGLAGYDMGRKQ